MGAGIIGDIDSKVSSARSLALQIEMGNSSGNVKYLLPPSPSPLATGGDQVTVPWWVLVTGGLVAMLYAFRKKG